MRRGLLALAVAIVSVAGVGQASAAEPPTLPQDTLTLRAQLHVSRVENAQLRAALADAEAKLAGAVLTAERATIEHDIRAAFGCAPDAPIEWSAFQAADAGTTRACVAIPTPAPPPAKD